MIEVHESVQGLLFDCDGTLVNSMPMHMKAWEHAISAYGGVWDYDLFYSHSGMVGKESSGTFEGNGSESSVHYYRDPSA